MPWIQRDADSKHPEVLEGNNCSFFRLIHPQRFNICISRSLGGFHIQGFVSSGGVERCHRNNETESITKGLGFGLSGRAGDLGDLILSYLSMTRFSERCILCIFWKSGSVKGSCARQQKSWICCQLRGCKKSPQQGELRLECYSQSPVCLTAHGVLYLHSRKRKNNPCSPKSFQLLKEMLHVDIYSFLPEKPLVGVLARLPVPQVGQRASPKEPG